MTALNKHAELRQLSEKATQGEWWSDVVETEGEYGEGEDRASGYHSYAVYVGSESLLDMTNSTAACIHEEWDHDYHMAWDETAKRNAEFIAAANPATVLALLDELETAEKCIAELHTRTVTVKLPADYRNDDGSINDDMFNTCEVVGAFREALAAVGIGVKGE
ncbi:TPA: ead/Ea22-like family protein [Citrobacter freundii]|nr:ead/Ea22-like family protein [Citrobacter freundii]